MVKVLVSKIHNSDVKILYLIDQGPSEEESEGHELERGRGRGRGVEGEGKREKSRKRERGKVINVIPLSPPARERER